VDLKAQGMRGGLRRPKNNTLTWQRLLVYTLDRNTVPQGDTSWQERGSRNKQRLVMDHPGDVGIPYQLNAQGLDGDESGRHQMQHVVSPMKASSISTGLCLRDDGSLAPSGEEQLAKWLLSAAGSGHLSQEAVLIPI
jgi:hypothetical protein